MPRAAQRVIRPRVLLVDKRPLIADALRHLLADEFDIVDIMTEVRSLGRAAEELAPDVLLVDIDLPSARDAAAQIAARKPGVKIIFLTQSREPEDAIDAFRHQPAGYLLKDAAALELRVAIREALAGRRYISPLVAERLVVEALSNPGGLRARQLTDREKEILVLLASGKSIREVASSLDITPRIVELHKSRIMQLLGVQADSELMRYALVEHLMQS
jgi:DNA-binding NarL/FixJ family response regulator